MDSTKFIDNLLNRIVEIIEEYGKGQTRNWKQALANKINELINDYKSNKGRSVEQEINFTAEISRMAYLYALLPFGIAAFKYSLIEANCPDIKE